jgi:hypothetical protein
MEVPAAKRRTNMPKAKSLDRDAALKLFRQHLSRADEILTGHVQRAMAETGGNLRRAARILGERANADPAYRAELESLDRYMKYVWPPMNNWPLPSGNPKRGKRRSPKRGTRKA